MQIASTQRMRGRALCRRYWKRKVLGPDHPSTLTSMNNLAGVLRDQGKLSEAEALQYDRYQRCKSTLGEDHLDTLVGLSSLAVVLKDQGKYGQAEYFLRQAVTRCTNVLGVKHPVTITNSNNLAEVLCGQGKFEEAIEMYQIVLKIGEQLLGRNHPITVAARKNLKSARNRNFNGMIPQDERDKYFQRLLRSLEPGEHLILGQSNGRLELTVVQDPNPETTRSHSS
jgi:tetratricopeptide (TPR) repeat protein